VNNDRDLNYLIAKSLAELWHLHKTDAFRAYISKAFGKRIDVLPQFDWLLVAECESGDINSGTLNSVYTRIWKVDDSGCNRSNARSIVFDIEREFFKAPLIRFYHEGNTLLIGERFGPKLMCYKRGSITIEGDNVIVENLVVSWMSS